MIYYFNFCEIFCFYLLIFIQTKIKKKSVLLTDPEIDYVAVGFDWFALFKRSKDEIIYHEKDSEGMNIQDKVISFVSGFDFEINLSQFKFLPSLLRKNSLFFVLSLKRNQFRIPKFIVFEILKRII